ncbi:hypothetical protein GE115_02915 [Agromyces sp. CFH 90414]|uniref:Uncharacterized protein n=1 Tax=Agromyces agglutinans TaxID=2662258 RepID=A0A6I2F526_9MICO|nr:hypothetical protein [Agromyces agglutinans]MRG58827.1 hypothetical protein [Agromyces agglutinans]
MSGAEASAPVERSGGTPFWLQVTLAVFFGLFFAYDLWEVVESLVQILSFGLGFTPLGWALMVVALLAPIGLFAAAFVLGRRRSLPISIACYLGGLAVSAVVFTSTTVLLGVSAAVVAP